MNSHNKKYDKLKEALNDITGNLRLLQFYPPNEVGFRGRFLYLIVLILITQPGVALLENWNNWNFNSRVSTLDNLSYSLGVLCLTSDLLFMPKKTKILIDVINSDFSVYNEEIRSYKQEIYNKKCELIKEMTQEGYKMAKMITTLLKYFFAVHVTIPIYGVCFYFMKSEDVEKLPLLIKMYSPLTLSLEMHTIQEYLLMSALQLTYMYLSLIFVIILLHMQILSIFHIRVEMKLFHMSVELINMYCSEMTSNEDGGVSESELRFMMRELARHHQTIFKYRKWKTLIMASNFACSISTHISVYNSAWKGQALLKLKYGIILVTLIPLAFFFCEDGQKFQDEGEELRISLYNCNWQNKPKWFTSSLQILMARNNKLPELGALFHVFTLNRNNLTVIVREHYLRDDLWCGSEACKVCRQDASQQVLQEVVNSESTLFPQPHYIVPDTNVVLDQIDILEEDAIQNVIILHTVLDEVKHRSIVVYKRLKDILKNGQSRKFYVFVNEHHKDTYVEREPGESSNDRNDRAIRKAVAWYNTHLSSSQRQRSKKDVLKVVLLTEDAANKEKAEAENILVASAIDYVNSLKNQPALADKLSSRQCNSELSGGKAPLFPPYLSPVEIQNGLKTGKLYQGAFLASRENFLEGQVNVENLDKPVLIQGRESLNRSVDGGVLEEEEERELKEAKKKKIEKQPTGKIVGIIRRKWRQYCGILQDNPVKGSVRHMFVPAERKIPRIRIETRQAEKLLHQRVIVSIDSWPRNSRYPIGHFVKALGKIGDKETENEVLLLEHDVPHGNFSEAVLSFLPKLPWVITPEDLTKRRDLRHLDVCSVDPPGCTDIDDALHCRLLDNGNYEVGVHIADVSHFIRPGNALDKEAALRATTVYLVDKRIDMVPDLLSSNLCSLREKVDRFAFSCIWEITKDAEIVKTDFCKSIIFSRGAFTYKEAQMRIDDSSQQNSIALSLRGLNSLAKILKKRRMENGALVLASPEIRFHVDSETHDPIDVKAKEMLETNSMVEEFMLLANISVAEKIYQEFPECAMLRRHPEPAQNMFEPLIKAGRHLGFDIRTTSGKELAASLDAARMPSNPYFNTMLRILATRCMMQAVYFCSGMLTKAEFAHYGLASPIYTHFTSPIRRYADIMVHRLLASCIGADTTYPELLDRRKNHNLCHNLNYRNRMAQYAGRASVALYTHIFFRDQVRDEEGYILFVRKNALQILVPRYGLEGTLYLKSPIKGKELDVEFVFNEEDHTQRCGNIVFHTFDPVTVQLSLDTSNVQHEKLSFRLVKPHIPGFSIPGLNDETHKPGGAEQTPSKRKESTTPSGKQSESKKKKKK
ncbi:hypothetical protein LSTR_LSTR005409 [Laodelphax striatellus]|uniref:Protein DIS3 homolog n=1 Tax=Laodelphax striatellus TaxID=195883 RepID=A0A482WWB3_LAOST|nr:hypothetical protein LSTR_LSTR005409 [Laodelphax striatellus]